MIEAEFIKHVQCQIINGTKGPGMNFYSLTSEGYQKIGLETSKYREPKNPTSTNLLHYYLCNVFFTGFSVIAKSYDGLSCQYLTQRQLFDGNHFHEYYLSKTPASLHDLFALPDFILCLSNNKTRILYIGEIDCSTESISASAHQVKSIERKFKSFSIIKMHDIQKYFNDIFGYDFDGFVYLHVTSGTNSRLSSIASLCQKESLYSIDEILLALADDIWPNVEINKSGRLSISYDNLLSNVWLRPSVGLTERSTILL